MYQALVQKVIKFLKGHDREIIQDLHKEMQAASEALEFEKAAAIFKKIEYIESTLENQKVEKAGSIDTDVLGIFRESDEVTLAQMAYREGKLLGVETYRFSQIAEDDDELIISFILQHYSDKENLPQAILTPIPLKESALLETLLSTENKKKIQVLFPQKGEKKALIEMAGKNAKARFEKEKTHKDLKERLLLDLEEQLELINFPEKIECFDQSNIAGTDAVSSMIVFIHGEKKPSLYRKFKIKEAGPSDDYGALKEVLRRRYLKAKEEGILPDLIVIDGGKGHLNIALSILSELDISTVDVIGVAKEQGRHDKGMTAEKVYIASSEEPLQFKSHSAVLFFLQKIRDEAHRFAITFHRQRRSKRSLFSALDEIPGIGPVKKTRLLKHFGSLKRVLAATDQQLLSIPGISQKDVEAIRKLSNPS